MPSLRGRKSDPAARFVLGVLLHAGRAGNVSKHQRPRLPRLQRFLWAHHAAAVSHPALPGTPEKIAILTQRASLGQELFHPDDALVDRRLVPKFAG